MTESKWFVWNPRGNVPSFEHSTEYEAKTEAERLARLNPGTRFLVLRSVGEVTKTDVTWTHHDPRPEQLEVPF